MAFRFGCCCFHWGADMRDLNDKQTVDVFGEKRKPGPKPSGKARTNAQRQRDYRQRVRAQLDELKALREQNGPVLPHPSKIDRFED